jgi:hypothetical protein
LTDIANCDINITFCDNKDEAKQMTLGEKIRYLRQVEGALRGLDREMT